MKYSSILSLFALFLIPIIQVSTQEKTTEKAQIAASQILVEPTFRDRLNFPMDKVENDICLTVVSKNAEDNVA